MRVAVAPVNSASDRDRMKWRRGRGHPGDAMLFALCPLCERLAGPRRRRRDWRLGYL